MIGEKSDHVRHCRNHQYASGHGAASEHGQDAGAHRGPDDEGIHCAKTQIGWLGLGHRRLSILDLSSAGHQPMCDADSGNVIVFNGEIYNHQQLRKDLPPHKFLSNSDTETLLLAYRHWKEHLLDRLVGMFAFAIWNAREERLFLARDRLGIKPLYFSCTHNRFVFASEIRSILATGMVSRKADPAAIESYLTFGAVHEPKTILKEVQIVPSGTYLAVGADGRISETKKYWSLSAFFQGSRPPFRPAADHRIKDTLREAVSARLLSDAPLGAFLSGGIDSSVIVGMMAACGTTPETFCLDFDEGPYREGKYAELVAQKFHCHHHRIMVQPESFLRSLEDAFLAMDQPTHDGINTYFVSGVTRGSGLKVALKWTRRR